MPWCHTAEIFRCNGRLDTHVDDRGRQRSKRCRSILRVGARFWLDVDQAYCEGCTERLSLTHGDNAGDTH
jgi:hypothetical protein